MTRPDRYFRTSTPVKIVERPAAMGNNAGPFHPSAALDDDGQWVTVTIGGADYYPLYFSTDHANPNDAFSGIWLYVCPVGEDVTDPSNWSDAASVSGSPVSNPLVTHNDTSHVGDFQMETPCVRVIADGTWVLTCHTSGVNGGQRGWTFLSQDGLSWTEAGEQYPGDQPGVLGNTHDGYSRWGRNLWFSDQPSDYVGFSLYTNSRGDLVNVMLWGTDLPAQSKSWSRLILQGYADLPRELLGFPDNWRIRQIERQTANLEEVNENCVAGLVSIGSAASGTETRNTDIAEVLYDRSGRVVSAPRTVIAHGDGVDYANEASQSEVAAIGQTKYLIFCGVAANDRNSILVSKVSFDRSAKEPATLRRRTYETSARNFVDSPSIPSSMALNGSTGASFEAVRGLVLRPGAPFPQGRGLLRLGPAFRPADHSSVDILIRGFTSVNAVPLVGFMTDDNASWPIEATEYVGAHTFGSNSGFPRLTFKNAAGEDFVNVNSHIMGANQSNGGLLPKDFGVRWWPGEESFAVVGPDSIVLHRVPIPRSLSLTSSWVPVIALIGNANDVISARGVRLGSGRETAPSFTANVSLDEIASGIAADRARHTDAFGNWINR